MFLKRCEILSKSSISLRLLKPNNALCQIQKTTDFDRQSHSSLISTDLTESRSENDRQRRLKLIQLEIFQHREEGHQVPDLNFLTQDHWDELLKLKTVTARKKLYRHLFVNEKRKENLLRKKQEKHQVHLELKKREASELPQKDSNAIPSLFSTSFTGRISDSRMTKWRNTKLTQAMMFGNKLIFDCSYDQYMVKREAINTAKQLMYCFADNREHKDPFDLYFCNADFTSTTLKQLELHIPTLRNNAFPLNVYEGSYLDLFPKEQLVYLTPHCQNDITVYDPESIYIIGAIVDKVNKEHFSLAKAEALGLRMARLPLDIYCQWGPGSGKSLTLDQMMKIMLDIKETGDWKFALRHVPRRKMTSNDAESQKRERKWCANVNKFKMQVDIQRSDDTTLPVADSSRLLIGTNNQLELDSKRNSDKSTVSENVENEKFKIVSRDVVT